MAISAAKPNLDLTPDEALESSRRKRLSIELSETAGLDLTDLALSRGRRRLRDCWHGVEIAETRLNGG